MHTTVRLAAGMVDGMQEQELQKLSKQGALFAAELTEPCPGALGFKSGTCSGSYQSVMQHGRCIQLARRRNLQLQSCADGMQTPAAESLLHTAPSMHWRPCRSLVFIIQSPQNRPVARMLCTSVAAGSPLSGVHSACSWLTSQKVQFDTHPMLE